MSSIAFNLLQTMTKRGEQTGERARLLANFHKSIWHILFILVRNVLAFLIGFVHNQAIITKYMCLSQKDTDW